MRIALTIFLSAFLLFQVQLILGKFFLPWFGGSSTVWTTCMLFFQTLLLLGYAYAHWLSARLSLAKQVRVHVGLLAGSGLLLALLWYYWGSPILPTANWRPTSPEQPVRQILTLLTVSVGLPFFLLSATSPLLQQWRGSTDIARTPYRLYALSNLGSMLGLLGYPLLVEPTLRVSVQAHLWGLAYLVFAVACSACAFGTRQAAGVSAAAQSSETSPAPDWRQVLLWLLLASVTSAMFLSVTNTLCQDVASVPFLWVVPLGIYLLTLIICFAGDKWYPRTGFIAATAITTLLGLALAFDPFTFRLTSQILFFSLFLFVFCMTCHGELVRLKPAPRHLTSFYLVTALGGVCGGVFVAVIAPLIFKGLWELPLTLTAGWIALGGCLLRDRTSFLYRGDRRLFLILVCLITYQVLKTGLEFTTLREFDFYWRHETLITWLAAIVLTLGIALAVWRRALARSKYWPRILMGGMILCSVHFAFHRIQSVDSTVVERNRNFYGLLRVQRSETITRDGPTTKLQLMHGRVNHGVQFQAEAMRHLPTGYYATNSGIELAFRLLPRRTQGAPLNIGVLGLGVGTLATFARPGDSVRLYEINPEVIAYSSGAQPRFTYVQDCLGTAEMILGDARLRLDKEFQTSGSARFDILALDAFSGDSVPVHLLTREAFELYLSHLRDEDSVIAVNISNRFLDLRDLMLTVAGHFKLQSAIIEAAGQPPEPTGSRWCLLSRNANFINQAAIQKARLKDRPTRHILWTDDFSNMLQLLRE